MLQQFQFQVQTAQVQVEVRGIDFDYGRKPNMGSEALIGRLNLIGCNHSRFFLPGFSLDMYFVV